MAVNKKVGALVKCSVSEHWECGGPPPDNFKNFVSMHSGGNFEEGGLQTCKARPKAELYYS